MVLVVKNLPSSSGDIRDVGLIPGLGRSPGGWHGNPLQYSCLENPMDRGAWQAVVHRVNMTEVTWQQQSFQGIGWQGSRVEGLDCIV